jgi:hypothetical protein
MGRTFRERATDRFIAAFGEPAVSPTPDGPLFRWILKAADGTTVRLTLDSPEFPDMAHIVVSDPKAVPRVASLSMRTLEETEAIIGQIRERLERGAA